jgi:hypothetical protein
MKQRMPACWSTLRGSYTRSRGSTDARTLTIRVELDQCWDLLRQRRALRDAGQDPNRARVRPASVVEKYEQ